MENNETMILAVAAESTPQERAERLDSRINANAEVAAESIGKMGRDLKAMRDERLYIELGCETFEDYCNIRTPIGQRQAYNFIKSYEKYGERLIELSSIGITKLALMTALSDEDSDELIESGDAENMSVRELAKRIKELQNKNEQLTLELDAVTKEEKTAIVLKEKNERLLAEFEAMKSVQDQQKKAFEQRENELKERIIALEQSNEELSARPVDVAVEKPSADEIAKIEKAAAEKAVKAAEKKSKQLREAEIKKLRTQLTEQADKERIIAVEAARKESAAEIERLKTENSVLQSNSKKAPPSAEKERVKFHIEECTRSFNAALESLNALPEEEREKPEKAMRNMVDKMRSLLEEDNS